jgi:hypothetical protein
MNKLPARILCVLTALSTFAALAPFVARASEAPFVITVLDDQTGRGVPLVDLRTTANQVFVTDSAGIAAIDDPSLMNQKVYFHIKSHGYEYPKDGFGYSGKALDVSPGGAAEFKLKRRNVAERLYRITGLGIYRDSVLAGKRTPLDKPLLNAEVTGQDSTQTAVYRGKYYWFWGDTNRLAYPLGHFGSAGAVSELPTSGGLDPLKGVNLHYFTGDNGFSRGTVEIGQPGLKWLDGLCALKDAAGAERLVARCTRLKKLGEIDDTRMVAFNDATERFETVALFDSALPLAPDAYAFEHDGYIYFCSPFPLVRVKANFEAYRDQRQYEAFTCLKKGTRLNDTPEIERGANGRALWTWKTDTAAIHQAKQNALLKRGVLNPEDAILKLTEAGTGENIVPHIFGSVAWNEHRKKWILLSLQAGGKTSYLGEVWYAEADTLEGPWSPATRIVTHDRYTFYNIRQHPLFDQENGRYIYFEGTYTAEFSGNPEPTSLYNYNQIMYRLDLDDPRLDGSRK